MNLIEEQEIENYFEQDSIKITFVQVPKEQAVTVFVIESNHKKLIYAPCDCVPFPDEPILYDADVLILGNTFIGNTLKNGRCVTHDYPLRKELHSLEDAQDIFRRIRAKRLIITHVEEDWGKSYDDYLEIRKRIPKC